MNAEAVIYQSLQAVRSLDLPVGEPASGKKFEDYMVMQLYQKLRQRTGFQVFPPRYTLYRDTFSGVSHQFDIVIAESEALVAIECKFRGGAHIDQLFATHGKLVDYCERPRGIFVTTAEKVNDEMYYYALAQRILLICSSLPPVEYMLQCVKKDTDLDRRLATLQSRIQDNVPPKHLLVEWKNSYVRFRDEGYC